MTGDDVQKEVAAAYFGGLIRQQNDLRYETSQQATMLRLLTAERDELKAKLSHSEFLLSNTQGAVQTMAKREAKLQKQLARLKKAK